MKKCKSTKRKRVNKSCSSCCNENVTMSQCVRCKQSYPIDDFKSLFKKDHFNKSCSSCCSKNRKYNLEQRGRMANSYQLILDLLYDKNIEKRTCFKCRDSHPIINFNNDSNICFLCE